MKSEFGKGLTYCLGLFLAHAERYEQYKKSFNKADSLRNHAPGLWFNGASDHLYELDVPKSLPKRLQTRLRKFRDKCLDLGHGMGLMNDDSVKEDDCTWAIQEAKDLLRLIDKASGIKTIKGSWE